LDTITRTGLVLIQHGRQSQQSHRYGALGRLLNLQAVAQIAKSAGRIDLDKQTSTSLRRVYAAQRGILDR
jgi:hypothetical protein